MKAIHVALFAAALSASQPSLAQDSKRTEFRGDPASESATAVSATGLEALRGVKSVVIPQFTVEFVERGSGLSSKQVKRQDSIEIDYKITPLSDAERQGITDRLYARWVNGLKAQGLTVLGPRDAAATKSWGKVSKGSRPSPELIARGETLTRIYGAETASFLMPLNATEAPTGGAALGAADAGAAVASRVGGKALGKLGGMFGAARSLGKMGSALGNVGGAWKYAAAETALAKESSAAVMTVSLVVSLRETDMASRGLGLFRTSGSYKGKPKLVIDAESTQVTVTPPVADRKGTRARLEVPVDLVFQEDLFAGKLVADNSAGQNAGNIANRAFFATAAVAGGSAAINQRYNFSLTPAPPAHAAAVERNLTAIEDIFLARLRAAW